jgi:hypothetical protein
MAFDQSEKLPDLIGFGFSLHFLDINQFRNRRMNKNVMASTYTLQSETESLDHIYHISKSNIIQVTFAEPFEQPSSFHPIAFRIPSGTLLIKLGDSGIISSVLWFSFWGSLFGAAYSRNSRRSRSVPPVDPIRIFLQPEY